MKANRSFKEFKKDDSALMFDMLLTAGITVVIFFALMNIGTYINGQIGSSLVDSYPAAVSRTTLENSTVSSLGNITADYDSVLDIMTVTAIIMVITLPLAAVIGVRRLI
jgi:hypothetical protein